MKKNRLKTQYQYIVDVLRVNILIIPIQKDKNISTT